MRKLEQYRVQEGVTPLSGSELSERFLDIDGRLHQLELLDISWQQAVAEIQNHGLERINGVIEPLLDQAHELVDLVQQNFDAMKLEWQNTVLAGWQDILDGWNGVRAELDGMQTEIDGAQAAAQSYADDKTALAEYQIAEWAAADENHPYTNFENCSVRGKATIKMPADSEAWLLGSFSAKKSDANINLAFRHMMSTSDTDPVNWGLATVVGDQDLCAIPRQNDTTYTIGDRVCANPPDGCTYAMIEGAGGFGTADLCTGGTAISGGDYVSNPKANAFDDNTGTYWGSSQAGSAVYDTAYIGYDLGSGNDAEVGKLRIYQYSDAQNVITAGNLQYSDDGGEWFTAVTLTFSTYGEWEEKTWSGAGSHRYWRLMAVAGTLGLDRVWVVCELEFCELLGSIGTSDSSQPTMNQTLNGETTDNEITWKCVSTDNYDTLSLTGETAPAMAWTESTKSFTIPGNGITAGDIIRVLAIRKVDAPSHYWQEQNLSAATVTAYASAGGTVPYGDTTIAGLYDGSYNDSGWAYAENCMWRSSYEGTLVGSYAQVQFASAKEIKCITVQQVVQSTYSASSIKIQYSTDGSLWNDLETFNASFGKNVFEISSPVAAATYRVVCNANPYQYSNGYRNWVLGEIKFETYETNPGFGHDGDLHLINATHQAVEV